MSKDENFLLKKRANSLSELQRSNIKLNKSEISNRKKLVNISIYHNEIFSIFSNKKNEVNSIFEIENDNKILLTNEKYDKWKNKNQIVKNEDFNINNVNKVSNKLRFINLCQQQIENINCISHKINNFYSLNLLDNINYQIQIGQNEKEILYNLTKNDISLLWNKLNKIDHIDMTDFSFINHSQSYITNKEYTFRLAQSIISDNNYENSDLKSNNINNCNNIEESKSFKFSTKSNEESDSKPLQSSIGKFQDISNISDRNNYNIFQNNNSNCTNYNIFSSISNKNNYKKLVNAIINKWNKSNICFMGAKSFTILANINSNNSRFKKTKRNSEINRSELYSDSSFNNNWKICVCPIKIYSFWCIFDHFGSEADRNNIISSNFNNCNNNQKIIVFQNKISDDHSITLLQTIPNAKESPALCESNESFSNNLINSKGDNNNIINEDCFDYLNINSKQSDSNTIDKINDNFINCLKNNDYICDIANEANNLIPNYDNINNNRCYSNNNNFYKGKIKYKDQVILINEDENEFISKNFNQSNLKVNFIHNYENINIIKRNNIITNPQNIKCTKHNYNYFYNNSKDENIQHSYHKNKVKIPYKNNSMSKSKNEKRKEKNPVHISKKTDISLSNKTKSKSKNKSININLGNNINYVKYSVALGNNKVLKLDNEK